MSTATETRVVVVVDEGLQPVRFKLRIGFAICGAFVGYSVAICLGGVYHNPSTAAFAAASGVLATVCLIMHWTSYKHRFHEEHSERLRALTAIGAIFAFVGVIGMVAFVAVAASLQQGRCTCTYC